MPYGKAYKLAWTAHDAAHQALTKFASSVDLWNGSKLSRDDAETLCHLLSAQDMTAERIRIIRNKPLPGTARPRKAISRRTRPGEQRPSVVEPTLPT